MNKQRLLTIAALLLSLPAVCAAQIQPTYETSRSYLRSTVSTLPEATGRPLLQYLDAGRVAADEGMRLCAEGKWDALYESMAANFKAKYSLEQFRQLSRMFEESVGRVVSYEYRNQSLSYPIDDSPMTVLSSLTKAKSDVWYALRTGKQNYEGIFMKVTTVREGGKHIVSFINLVDYSAKMPPWLHRDAPAAPK
jgi:hypothetical protein